MHEFDTYDTFNNNDENITFVCVSLCVGVSVGGLGCDKC